MHMVNGEIRGVSCSGPSMTFEQSYLKFEEFEFPIIFYQNIKNHGKNSFSSHDFYFMSPFSNTNPNITIPYLRITILYQILK